MRLVIAYCDLFKLLAFSMSSCFSSISFKNWLTSGDNEAVPFAIRFISHKCPLCGYKLPIVMLGTYMPHGTALPYRQ